MKFPNFFYFCGLFLVSWIRIRIRVHWPDRIRIHRPDWIRIQSGSRSETLGTGTVHTKADPFCTVPLFDMIKTMSCAFFFFSSLFVVCIVDCVIEFVVDLRQPETEHSRMYRYPGIIPGELTREKVRGATVHKAGSKISTWLTVSPVYKLW